MTTGNFNYSGGDAIRCVQAFPEIGLKEGDETLANAVYNMPNDEHYVAILINDQFHVVDANRFIKITEEELALRG